MRSEARGVSGKDALILSACAAAAGVLHAPVLLGARAYFSNDILHVNWPWRTLTAQMLQQGRLPLWNPYPYFGMPLLGTMQTGQFHPLSLLFHIFPFPAALGPFLWINQSLAALWTFLWMRRWGLGRPASAAAAAGFSLSGGFVGFIHNPNVLATLAQVPAAFLFWGRLLPGAFSAATGLLAGYPVFWAAGSAAVLWLDPAMRGWRPRDMRLGIYSLAAGALLSALVILPGAELAGVSNRVGGTIPYERSNTSYEPLELATVARPEVARWLMLRGRRPEGQRQDVEFEDGGTHRKLTFYSDFIDTVEDSTGIKFKPTRSGYLGVVGALLAALGLAALAARRPVAAAAWAAWLGLCALLVLGQSTALSRWAWARPPMNSLRGPGRFVLLVGFAAAPLIAAGVEAIGRRRRAAAWAAVLLLAGELVPLGRHYYPTAARGYFYQRGALVDFLARNLKGGERYFQVTNQEVWPYVNKSDPSPEYARFKAMVFDSYKQKLYGIGGSVYHFYSGSGDYESLFPKASGQAGEALQTTPDERRPGLMRWAGVRFWFDRRPVEGPLLDRGKAIWRAYETPKPAARARWEPSRLRAALAGGLNSAPEETEDHAWETSIPREDRTISRGTAPEPGILFMAEPYYPGWETFVNGTRARAWRALGAFCAVDVPAGAVTVVRLYRPASWAAGLAVSLSSLLGLLSLGLARSGASPRIDRESLSGYV